MEKKETVADIKDEEINKDKILMPTPGRSQLFEEPILDAYADKITADVKEKLDIKLTANDKFILRLSKNLPVGDLLQKGYMEISLDVGSGIECTVRTLVYKQVEAVAADISRFQQQKEVEKDLNGVEREVWKPSLEEVRVFQVKRTLAEVVSRVSTVELEPSIRARMSFFDNLDSMLVNAIYRKVQQFLTAVSLLFPSDNQKELVTTLKKAYAPLE